MKPWIDIIADNWQLKLLSLISALMLWLYLGLSETARQPHTPMPQQQHQEETK